MEGEKTLCSDQRTESLNPIEKVNRLLIFLKISKRFFICRIPKTSYLFVKPIFTNINSSFALQPTKHNQVIYCHYFMKKNIVNKKQIIFKYNFNNQHLTLYEKLQFFNYRNYIIFLFLN